jgi:hypothetical protein
LAAVTADFIAKMKSLQPSGEIPVYLGEMKRFLCSFALAIAVSGFGVRAIAAGGAIDDIETLLQQAETGPDPASLLTKAKDDLTKIKTGPEEKGTARNQFNAKRSVNAAAGKRKEEALRAIDEAIATAKKAPTTPKDQNSLQSGPNANPADELKAKIESARTKVHMLGELKH